MKKSRKKVKIVKSTKKESLAGWHKAILNADLSANHEPVAQFMKSIISIHANFNLLIIFNLKRDVNLIYPPAEVLLFLFLLLKMDERRLFLCNEGGAFRFSAVRRINRRHRWDGIYGSYEPEADEFFPSGEIRIQGRAFLLPK